MNTYSAVPAHHTASTAVRLINQNTILTINQAKPITTRPIAACFKIVNHLLYFSSSPAASTIWNPHRRTITKATRAKIPSVQFTNHFITFAIESSCHSLVPTNPIESAAPGSFGSVKGLIVLSTWAKTPAESPTNAIIPIIHFIMLFISFIGNKVPSHIIRQLTAPIEQPAVIDIIR